MNSKEHYIKKQFLDFEFSTKSKALEWQQKVPLQYQQDYAKIIEKILDSYDDGAYRQIDKIIVDLGTVREDEVVLKIEKELDNVLKKVLQKRISENEIPMNDTGIKSKKQMITASENEQLTSVFLHFLSKGNFPWNATFTSVAELEEALFEQFSIQQLVTILRSKKILHKRVEKMRLCYQFSDVFVKEVVSTYFKTEYANLLAIVEFCEKQFGEPQFRKHFRKQTKSESLQSISEWITLNAPENRAQWSIAFTKFLITSRWLAKIPLSYAVVRTALKQQAQSDTQEEITEVLERIFRHIDLRLSAYKKEGELALDSAYKQEEASTSEKEATHVDRKQNLAAENVVVTKNEGEKLTKIAKEEKEEKGATQGNKDEYLEKDGYLEGDIKTREHKKIRSSEDPKYDNLEQEAETNQKISDVKEEKFDKAVDLTGAIEESIDRKFKEEEKEGEKDAFIDSKLKGIGKESNDSSEQKAQQLKLENYNESTLNEGKGEITSKEKPIVPEEFYKEVTETIDTMLPLDQNLWEKEAGSDALSSGGHYIQNSGLVLVWPYLNHLFKKLGYIDDKQFVSKEKQERAILLLGYIATGKSICEEHQLVLAKFLCNWPFQMPIKKEIELTKQERKEAADMLNSLIMHWSILKNTSVDGLRDSFFWREGKLFETEDRWKLTVEQKGIDILLSHLAYGISIIKLPWLNKMLQVDWA